MMIARALLSFAALATVVAVGGPACTTVKGENDDGGLAPDGAPLPPGSDGGVRDGGGDGSSTITGYGSISLWYSDLPLNTQFDAVAHFQRGARKMQGANHIEADAERVARMLASCQSDTEGDCVSYVCAPDAGSTVDPECPRSERPTTPNAGTISISGARIPAGTTLTPRADGIYRSFTKQGLKAWSGGETLSISADGADVPPFTGTVTAPAPNVALTSPATSSIQKADIDRSKPLPVAWSGAGAGTLTLIASARGGLSYVECQFDASKGKGQMPAKLLAKLPAGDAGFGGWISTTEQVKAGSYSITLRGYGELKNSLGQELNDEITLK
jgi:hypothetical protein